MAMLLCFASDPDPKQGFIKALSVMTGHHLQYPASSSLDTVSSLMFKEIVLIIINWHSAKIFQPLGTWFTDARLIAYADWNQLRGEHGALCLGVWRKAQGRRRVGSEEQTDSVHPSPPICRWPRSGKNEKWCQPSIRLLEPGGERWGMLGSK